ncbi:helix-turn-helix transcriptional regulator [Gemmobacter fulvus]|uniref:Helix-turn-helix transcriptional regulator n=1 Tax=Gemmobacter fulvus TaxID=2840474 RepID=A0A975P575_9RHOB|nr:helix-turn-helix transcriptional regulator [Gemmobacter fulvus]MBT9247099.1 helix-turn-helix transcriptional regulator [Gemmobacter fulvus]MDQ1847519.1 helix-turn-helix transcriptional regulator [Gemmobacter fulvus]QWK89864.1 helix-turn-helix transcriptional regulator [Gemmobacter fulvus]
MTGPTPARFRRFLTRGSVGIGLLLAVQGLCAAVFILDILSSLIGFRAAPISWQLREIVELGAALGLLTGLGLGAYALRHALAERNMAEARLRRASGAFAEILNERFCEWGLTPAERDVALFAIKGLSTAEIAALRETSEGTVKAQTNAIYRKASVTGRPQLLSLFIEELMRDDGPLHSTPAEAAKPRAVPRSDAA